MVQKKNDILFIVCIWVYTIVHTIVVFSIYDNVYIYLTPNAAVFYKCLSIQFTDMNDSSVP